MKQCPECDGHGGGRDFMGEWDDCPLCHATGKTTRTKIREWHAENARIDADIDRLMNAPCPTCGVIEGNHINRHGDPCETV